MFIQTVVVICLQRIFNFTSKRLLSSCLWFQSSCLWS